MDNAYLHITQVLTCTELSLFSDKKEMSKQILLCQYQHKAVFEFLALKRSNNGTASA